MEKIITIDGRPIPFRATAALPRLYRIKFRRDIVQDVQSIQKAIREAEQGGSIPAEALTLFENVAYIMAKHADPELPAKTPDEWLEGFETFSIYQVFPDIFELWQLNNETLNNGKKK